MSTRWTENDLRAYTTRRLKDEAWARERMQNATNNSVGALERTRTERNPILPLDGGIKEQRRRKGRVSVCVTLISCRRRELDSDNLQFALKPIRDAVANAIGCDDADARLRWQYAQQLTAGEQGTIIIVEQV